MTGSLDQTLPARWRRGESNIPKSLLRPDEHLNGAHILLPLPREPVRLTAPSASARVEKPKMSNKLDWPWVTDRWNSYHKPFWAWLQRQWVLFLFCFLMVWTLPYLMNLFNSMFLSLLLQLAPEAYTVLPLQPNPPPGTTPAITGAGNVPNPTGAAGTTPAPPGKPQEGVSLFALLSWELFWDRMFIAAVVYVLVAPAIGYVRKCSPALSLAPFHPETLPITISRVRWRARLLRLSAVFAALLIVAALILGLLVFLSADRLALQSDAPPDPAKPHPQPQQTAPVQPMDQNTTILLIASSLGTRIGAVLLLIWLVGILVQMYQYTLRLAATYDEKADALQLAGTNISELRDYAAILSSGLDFGKQPKSPLEEVATAAKNLSQIVEKNLKALK